jgi:hypothetical protein
LVKGYISEERTIVLAVVSAKNDYANQVILKDCRTLDPKGTRTLGVITKPDYLRHDSENEGTWLDLAQNRDIFFELGWHLLKNRGDGEHHFSFTERNAKERAFFNSGNYKPLPHRIKGIFSLRERLSTLLFHHLKQELPALKAELDEITRSTSIELDTFGKSRSTLADQRVYLAELFTSSWVILNMGVSGNYENEFFGRVNTKAAVEEEQNAYRFRAVVQHLNIQFAERMRQQGHKYSIDEETDTEKDNCDASNEIFQFFGDKKVSKKIEKLSSVPQRMAREEAIQWVLQIMQRSRGRELPGTFNPILISHLFWDQSERWESLARGHIDLVANACERFVLHVLDHVTAPEVKSRLLTMTVSPALKAAYGAATNELKLIIEDKKRHPITYNHYFTDALQKTQQERYTRRLSKLSQEATVSVSQKTFTGGSGYEQREYIKPEAFKQALDRTTEKDMDRFSAEQALDAYDAYYKVERRLSVRSRTLMAPV